MAAKNHYRTGSHCARNHFYGFSCSQEMHYYFFSQSNIAPSDAGFPNKLHFFPFLEIIQRL
jgi:hypothetical protein